MQRDPTSPGEGLPSGSSVIVGTTLRERRWGPTSLLAPPPGPLLRLAACAPNPDPSPGSQAGKCLPTSLDPHPPVHVFAFSA